MGDSRTVTLNMIRAVAAEPPPRQYPAQLILSRAKIHITADHPGNRKWIQSIVDLWPQAYPIIAQRLGWND